MAEIDLSTTRSRWIGWLVFLTVFFGGAMLFAILSAVNAQRMAVVVEDNQLALEEGDWLPFGTHIETDDPIFAPVEIPSGVDIERLPVGDCEERVDCERRFYESLLVITGELLETPDAVTLEQARRLLVRAQLFPSITLAERAPIEDLTGGIHFVEAQVMLEQVRVDLGVIYKKLERSRIAGVSFVDKDEVEALAETVRKQILALEMLGFTEPVDVPEPSPELDPEATESTPTPADKPPQSDLPPL